MAFTVTTAIARRPKRSEHVVCRRHEQVTAERIARLGDAELRGDVAALVGARDESEASAHGATRGEAMGIIVGSSGCLVLFLASGNDYV